MKEIATHRDLPYPRICAHRGMHMDTAPENSLPAFAMAAALGADEIELDLWPDKEGELFVFHDPWVIDGSRKTLISDMTTREVRAVDIGTPFSPAFKGLGIPSFEEVLDLVARRVILNIHIKSPIKNRVMGEKMRARIERWKQLYYGNVPLMPPFPDREPDTDPVFENREFERYSEKDFQHILDLLDRYRCREHAYIAGERDVLAVAQEMAPDIERCCLEAKNDTIMEHALRYDCKKVQFDKEATTSWMLEQAHAHGMTCNMFWSNIGEEACAYLDYGIDCILTDSFQAVSAAVKARQREKCKQSSERAQENGERS